MFQCECVSLYRECVCAYVYVHVFLYKGGIFFALIWEDVMELETVSDLPFLCWQALLDRVVCHVRALAVLPTKELAQQVSSEGSWFLWPLFFPSTHRNIGVG